MARKMKDSGIEWIGEIPEEWSISKYKYVCKIQTGFPFNSDLFDNAEGFPLIRIRDITSGVIETFYKGKYSEEFIVREGDLLVGMDGDFNIRWWNNVEALLNQRCCRIKESTNVKKRYLYYCLPFELKNINDLTYSTTVKHLSDKDILNASLVIPPLTEQQTISDYLDHKCYLIDSTIEKQRAVIEKLKLYKQSIITEAVTKGLDPNVKMKDSGIEWIGEIPDGWKVVTFKKVTRIKYGLSQPPKQMENGIPLIRATNVQRGKINDENLLLVDPSKITSTKDVILKTGDIIVVRSGAYTGDSAIITDEYNGSLAGYDMVVTPEDINSKFLSYVLLSNYVLNGQIYLQRLRAAQPHLNAEELGMLKIVRPKQGDQQAIADFLDKKCAQIDTLIANKEKLIDKLTEYKKSLIYECVTGKREVV